MVKRYSVFDSTSFFNDFYGTLKIEGYRSEMHSEVRSFEYIYGERDVYNVVKIPENVKFDESVDTENIKLDNTKENTMKQES